MSPLTAAKSGSGTPTGQVISESWANWVRRGKVVQYVFWVRFNYYQSSYNETPDLLTGMPPSAMDEVCGFATIDDYAGIALSKVTSSGGLRVVKRMQDIKASGAVFGCGTYLAAD